LNSPGDEAAVLGKGASAAVMRCQKASVLSSVPALKVSLPKLTRSGITVTPSDAASAAYMSDAESVKIATRLKGVASWVRLPGPLGVARVAPALRA
jgi:hypothetical protein